MKVDLEICKIEDSVNNWIAGLNCRWVVFVECMQRFLISFCEFDMLISEVHCTVHWRMRHSFLETRGDSL
jgi:hypothetical protein